MRKFMSLALALCLVLSMSAFASADEITTADGSGTTPVYLSSTSNGKPDGEPAATAMSVTIPTGLPMHMAQDGTVTTASNMAIVNNSYGAVRVKSASITAGNHWHLTAFGDKSSLANEKVDSNKLGFYMTIGGGDALSTDSTNASTQTLLASPIEGCRMSGSGDPSSNSVAVLYNAIVTPLSTPVTKANVANIVFVIEWDTAA